MPPAPVTSPPRRRGRVGAIWCGQIRGGCHPQRIPEAAGKRIEGKKGYKKQPEVFDALRDIKEAMPDAPLRMMADELARRGFLTSAGKTMAPNQINRLLARL